MRPTAFALSRHVERIIEAGCFPPHTISTVKTVRPEVDMRARKGGMHGTAPMTPERGNIIDTGNVDAFNRLRKSGAVMSAANLQFV